MKRSIVALLALGAFALGLFVSPFVMGFGRTIQGSVTVRCVGQGACVGDTSSAFLRSHNLEDRIGGVSGVFCGPDGQGDWLFITDLLEGRTCPQPRYVEFRTPTTRTLVSVEDGVVREIQQGPLHTIDF